MGKNKNKNKNKSKIVFDSDDEIDKNNKKQLLSSLDNDDDFQPVKKGAKVNMFQMLKQEESENESFEEVLSEKVNVETNKTNLETESFEEVLSEKVNVEIPNKELFKIAFDEDSKGNQTKAIEYYTILVERSHKVSMHNLAHIYWERDELQLALELFEKALKSKYLNSFYDYAVLVSDNLNVFSKYKTQAMEYLKTYMILKNATPEEKEIYFDLFDF